jgi:YD repeat-containing protein
MMRFITFLGLLAVVVTACRKEPVAPVGWNQTNLTAIVPGKTISTNMNDWLNADAFDFVSDLILRDKSKGQTTYDGQHRPLETIFPDGIKFIYDGVASNDDKQTIEIAYKNEKILTRWSFDRQLTFILYPDNSYIKLHYASDLDQTPSGMAAGILNSNELSGGVKN